MFLADAELVASRVGHDTEPVRRVVIQPESLGTELLSAIDPLPRVVDEDVEMQPVLDVLGLWDPLQVEYREPGRWLEMDPSRVNVAADSIPEQAHPELSDGTRIDHVDTHLNGPNRVHRPRP